MNATPVSFLPALGLLALLVALAWGVQWMKKRMMPSGPNDAQLRLVSQLALGPQHRVVVVEVQGPRGPVQLTLGVTPQQINTLHSQPPLSAGAPSPTPVAPPATPTPTGPRNDSLLASVRQAVGQAAGQRPTA